MADDVQNHVTVDITVESVGVPREGFGVPLIASHAAAWAERTRSYQSAAGVGEDFATDSPEYIAAARAFAQNPSPPLVKIGRVNGALVTQQYTLHASSIINSTAYTLAVQGEGFEAFDATTTSDAAATRAEIHRGLVNALNSGFLATLTFADKTVSAVDTVDNELDFAAPHGLSTGDGPIQLTTTGGAPAGLAVLTDYYVIAVDADSISLATSRTNALEGIEIDITTGGSGTHKIVDTSDTKHIDNNYVAAYAALVVADFDFTATNATNTFTKVAHTLLTGDGPVQVSNSGGALPAGLVALTDYWVIRVDDDNFKLATTLALALAGTEVDITTDGTGTQTLDVIAGTKRPDDPFTVTADANANWFSLGIPAAQLARLSMQQTHAAGDLDVELQAILDEDDAWYCLLTNFNSKAYVLEAAAWVESANRIYVVDVVDTEAVTTPETPDATDTLHALLALSYARTMYAFHPRPAAMLSAGWMGRWLPTLPGKATPKFKTLSGVETTKLTATMRANLINRRGNGYETAGGRGITFEGTVGNTTFAFLDVTRNRDWLADQVRSEVFGVEAGADIVPYTGEGIATVYGAVRGIIFGISIEQGVLSADPEPVVTAPKISEVSATDKLARELRNIKFSGTLQGAVHKVAVVGTVTF